MSTTASAHRAAAAALAAVLLAPGPLRADPADRLAPLPSARPGTRVDLAAGAATGVHRTRDEESAIALRLRGAYKGAPTGGAAPGGPRIADVNAKAFAQVTLTPGGVYAVQGQGFGSQPGQLRLTGQFPGGVLPAQVEVWSDGLVLFRIAADFGGASDHAGVALQLVTAGGASASQVGGRFVAARETIVVTQLPPGRVRESQPAPTVQALPDGRRVVRGGPCFMPGADDYDLASLPHGFAFVGYTWGYEQPPDSDQRLPDNVSHLMTTTAGSYAAQSLPGGTGLRIQWGVTHRAVGSRVLGVFVPASERCDSTYAVAFRFDGPRGLHPFLQQPVVSMPAPAGLR